MSNNKQVVIRIYNNPRFGKYIGPNRKNMYLLNGTMHAEGYGFFVFDAAQFDETGRSNCPDQSRFYGDLATELAAEHFGCTHENADNFLSGILYEYDRATKTKLDGRRGVVVISFIKNEMF